MTTGKETTIRLADYRDKLIILDYWFTGCKPCIRSLIKLDSILAERPQNDVIVIPFTYETAEYAKRWTLSRFKWNMTSIVADEVLRKHFIHDGFMNMAWIKDGKVIATPFSVDATAENMDKVIRGEQPDMPLHTRKKKQPENREKK